MSKGTYLIGVDIGTMGTKAAVFDASGVLLGDAFEESRLVYPRAGCVEQDMEDMYGSCLRTIKAAVEKAG
ncbi:MAG: FGGY family carbohydrate kinase, partial [Betaproteobacteria bacterium]